MKKSKAAVVIAALLAPIAIAAPAKADYVGDGCVSDFWMYKGLRGSTRLICDGPIQPDGSWLRSRGFFADPYYRSICYTYWCEGRVVPELKVIDHYPVTPDTVLPDEPGHIPGG